MELLTEIARFTLLVPVVFSFFIIKKADKVWLPFFLFLYAGIIVELISLYQNRNNISNAVATNIYALAEILLLIWLFANHSLFKTKRIAILLGAFFIIAFIIENFLIERPHTFNSYFNIFSSLTVVIMSILSINKIILEENKTLIKNPFFLACICFIVYFTYLALVEIFYIYGINQEPSFSLKVYSIHTWINPLTNLTYAIVILWIPRKNYSLL